MTPSATHPRCLIAEWEPQSGVLLTWPHRLTDWGPTLDAAEAIYLRLVAAIAQHEPVIVCCRDAAHHAHITARLAAAAIPNGDMLRLCEVDYDDTWTRDYGPLSVRTEQGLALVSFQFNGWGGRFDARRDNNVTRRLHGAGVFGATPLESENWVLEGGSVETDGAGTILTTSRCLLSATRNAGADKTAVEQVLRRTLGARRVLWLDHGHLAGDDTDSHVDILARFCDPATIAYTRCDDPGDEHYEPLRAMRAQIEDFRRADGSSYRLVALPLPSPVYDPDGRRLAATYANFLIINGAVLLPVYRDPMDATAYERLSRCFPDREIIALDARALIHQGGSIHCATMQLARGALSPPLR